MAPFSIGGSSGSGLGSDAHEASMEAEDIECEECGVDDQEGRKPKLMRSPVLPSKQEVEEHNVTHIPYRDWCEHCVKARANNDGHAKGGAAPSEDEAPMVGMDYAFLISKIPTPEGEMPDQCGPVIVIKENKYGNTFSMVVPAKGVCRPWVPDRIVKWIDSLGYNKITLKCDGEPAIKDLAGEIKSRRGPTAETRVESPEPGESQSNAVVERAVGVSEGMIRTIKSALEIRIGKRITPTDKCVPWLVEHASQLYSRFKVGKDGRTPL